VILSTPVCLNKFNFLRELTFNLSLKLVKILKTSDFATKEKKIYFVWKSTKITKYQKPLEDNIGEGHQISLKINSRGVEVLWPIGPNDRRDDFPNEQAWQLKWNCFGVNDIFLFDTKKLKMRKLRCPSQQCQCQISIQVERHANKKAWGNKVAEDSYIM
jgi:hypothetical protein